MVARGLRLLFMKPTKRPTRPSVQSIPSERLADITGGLGRNLSLVPAPPPEPEVNRNLK